MPLGLLGFLPSGRHLGHPPRLAVMTTHISVKEAAQRYSVCPDTIRRAIRSHQLKAVKLTPQIVRIPVKALEQWAR